MTPGRSAGRWIEIGAFLCLYGSSPGSLTALLGRVAFSLAERGVLPRRLAEIQPGSQTLFELLGDFSVLGFLLVYGIVAIASLRTPLAGSTARRRVLVGGACLTAVLAVLAAYLGSLVGQGADRFQAAIAPLQQVDPDLWD